MSEISEIMNPLERLTAPQSCQCCGKTAYWSWWFAPMCYFHLEEVVTLDPSLKGAVYEALISPGVDLRGPEVILTVYPRTQLEPVCMALNDRTVQGQVQIIHQDENAQKVGHGVYLIMQQTPGCHAPIIQVISESNESAGFGDRVNSYSRKLRERIVSEMSEESPSPFEVPLYCHLTYAGCQMLAATLRDPSIADRKAEAFQQFAQIASFFGHVAYEQASDVVQSAPYMRFTTIAQFLGSCLRREQAPSSHDETIEISQATVEIMGLYTEHVGMWLVFLLTKKSELIQSSHFLQFRELMRSVSESLKETPIQSETQIALLIFDQSEQTLIHFS